MNNHLLLVGDCSQLTFKAAAAEIEEFGRSLTAAKEVNLEATVAGVLSGLDGVFTFVEKTKQKRKTVQDVLELKTGLGCDAQVKPHCNRPWHEPSRM